MWRLASSLAPPLVQCSLAGFRIVLDGGTRWWLSSLFRQCSVGADDINIWWAISPGQIACPWQLQLRLLSNCHLYTALQQHVRECVCVAVVCVCVLQGYTFVCRKDFNWLYILIYVPGLAPGILSPSVSVSLSPSLSLSLFVHRWHFGLLNIGGHVHVATCYNWIRIDDRDCC